MGLIQEHVQEPRDQQLEALISVNEFFTAPASSRYHGKFQGGLAKHTLGVLRHALALNEAWECGIEEESIVVACLLHDLPKGGLFKQPYYLMPGGRSYKMNDKLPALSQAQMTIFMCQKEGFELHADEFQAILGQDGMFSGDGEKIYNGKADPSSLAYVVHFSDWYMARVIGI